VRFQVSRGFEVSGILLTAAWRSCCVQRGQARAWQGFVQQSCFISFTLHRDSAGVCSVQRLADVKVGWRGRWAPGTQNVVFSSPLSPASLKVSPAFSLEQQFTRMF